MHRIFRRSIFWLVPVILLPLAVLLVLQYRFLRDLQDVTASAERNHLRNTLESVTQEIEAQYRARAGRALTMSEAQLKDVGKLGEHFRRNRVPGGRTFFTIRYREHMSEWGIFDATGWEREPMSEETEAIKMASSSWQLAHKLGRIVPVPSLGVDERDPHHRVIMRPVTDDSMHVIGVVGVVLDEAAAKNAMMGIGTDLLKKKNNSRSYRSLRIGDRFPRMPRGREYFTQPLGFVFTNWRAGIRDICMGPDEIAAAHFRVNMGWTGAGAFVLLCAIALAIQAAARQMRLSQMKSDFVSNVSHELRTPLSSIRVFGEYMRLGRVTKDEKIREYGEFIEAESRRLTQLINNILDFSKIESAEKKYRFCETDVVDLVSSIVAAFEVALREKGFAITFDAPADPPLLHIDKDAIGQVIVNLVDNAVKYSGDRKEIAVHVTSENDEVRIAVHDRGIGIPAIEQKKIFEKFYRVGSTLVHDVKGSGLGLAIVKHVVKAHGGRVEVTSAPGEGSTFTIVLPATNGSRAIPSEARDPLPRGPAGDPSLHSG